MEKQDIFLIIILATLIFIYLTKISEFYVSGSYDITPNITVGMDLKGSNLSRNPYYPNNLINPTQEIKNQIIKLQSYESEQDGNTMSNYVSKDMKNISDNLEGFTMMNPYVSNN